MSVNRIVWMRIEIAVSISNYCVNEPYQKHLILQINVKTVACQKPCIFPRFQTNIFLLYSMLRYSIAYRRMVW